MRRPRRENLMIGFSQALMAGGGGERKKKKKKKPSAVTAFYLLSNVEKNGDGRSRFSRGFCVGGTEPVQRGAPPPVLPGARAFNRTT